MSTDPYFSQDEFEDWIDCWKCGGEGYTDHDCGEDCCCCLNPEPNVRCDECDGKGGWKRPAPDQWVQDGKVWDEHGN
jgi:hypothetical protein